jgi:sortase A
LPPDDREKRGSLGVVTRSTRQRMLAWSGSILIVAGLAALGWYGFSVARTRLYQYKETSVLNREILLRPARAMPIMTPKQGELLGSLSIPRVGISSVVLEGADDHTLALSVGHIPGTAVPGEDGNVALAGHRDTFFRGLRNIRNQDDILVTTPSGVQVYQVESARVVSPEDVYVLKDVGRPLLTLVTCYPFYFVGHAPKRFIVQAHLLDP